MKKLFTKKECISDIIKYILNFCDVLSLINLNNCNNFLLFNISSLHNDNIWKKQIENYKYPKFENYKVNNKNKFKLYHNPIHTLGIKTYTSNYISNNFFYNNDTLHYQKDNKLCRIPNYVNNIIDNKSFINDSNFRDNNFYENYNNNNMYNNKNNNKNDDTNNKNSKDNININSYEWFNKNGIEFLGYEIAGKKESFKCDKIWDLYNDMCIFETNNNLEIIKNHENKTMTNIFRQTFYKINRTFIHKNNQLYVRDNNNNYLINIETKTKIHDFKHFDVKPFKNFFVIISSNTNKLYLYDERCENFIDCNTECNSWTSFSQPIRSPHDDEFVIFKNFYDKSCHIYSLKNNKFIAIQDTPVFSPINFGKNLIYLACDNNYKNNKKIKFTYKLMMTNLKNMKSQQIDIWHSDEYYDDIQTLYYDNIKIINAVNSYAPNLNLDMETNKTCIYTFN